MLQDEYQDTLNANRFIVHTICQNIRALQINLLFEFYFKI